MAKLNVTDRKLLVKEILKKLDTNPEEEQQKFFEEYLKSTKQKKKYDELVKQQELINELTKKQREDVSKLERPSVTHSYHDKGTLNGFERLIELSYDSKKPSEQEIETKILLSGSDDLNALILSIVNEYKTKK